MHPRIAERIAKVADLSANATVLEIGPGRGILTRALLARAGRVIAVEADEALYTTLQSDFAGDISSGRLELIHGDIRAFDIGVLPRGYQLVANIPYYLTGEIFRMFLESKNQPSSVTLLVQKEVAVRIARSRKQSILSLSVKAYGTPKVIAKVRKPHFSPPPSVDSAILLIDNISRKFFADISEDNFFKVVRTGFASKRKMLVNNLLSLSQKADVLHALNACSIAKNTRAEKVSLEEWRCLTKRLS